MVTDTKLMFCIAACVFALLGYIPYLRDILRGKTQPHMYSWLVWTILQSIGAIAQFRTGAGYGAAALALGCCFCFSIFALSFRFGTKNISRFDLGCLLAACASIAVYFCTDNALWSVILISVIDFAGFLPTFRKGYEEPYSETLSAYVISAVYLALSLAAVEHYALTTVLYIASIFLTNFSFASLLIWRRQTLRPA